MCFEGVDLQRVREMNLALLRAALGGGADCHFFVSIRRVHAGIPITNAQFERFHSNFVKALEMSGVTGEDLENASEVIAAYKTDVVNLE